MEYLVGVAERRKRLRHEGVAEFLLAHPGHRIRQMPLTSTVIEVQMGVDHRVDVGRPEATRLELRWKRLLIRLLWELEGQELLDRPLVEARVEQEQPVGVIDQHAVDREPGRVARVDVPHDVGAVDDQAPGVEQPDAVHAHLFLPPQTSCPSSVLRTATRAAARLAGSSASSSSEYWNRPPPVFSPSLPSSVSLVIVSETPGSLESSEFR